MKNMENMKNTANLPLAAVRELFPAHEIDALLVSGPENRRYLSGFTADDPAWGMLLITARAALLLTDFRYQSWAQQEVRDFEVLIYKVDLAETLAERLKDLKVSRLGFEAAHLTYWQYQHLTKKVADAGLTVTWQPAGRFGGGLKAAEDRGRAGHHAAGFDVDRNRHASGGRGTRSGPHRAPGGLGDRKTPAGGRG